MDDKVSDSEDVTVRLKRWRDKCNINGRIILLQCTSPNITIESMEKIRNMSINADCKEVIVSTVIFNEVKYSALLFLDDDKKYLKQAIPNSLQITKPRQELK